MLLHMLRGLGLALGLSIMSGGVANSEGRLLAWIDVEVEGHIVQFHAFAQADEAKSVQYSLSVTKQDRGGRANTKQGGKADLSEERGAVKLSSVGVNIEDDTVYKIQLLVTSESGESVRVELSSPAENSP